ncbi:MAG TPA: PEGA domain-containing protein [Candidatus Saccharimonadia bacterium]|nr:PEGA domain-containing protein [Candidatus Saccharimonadia bacterium]
MLRRILLILGYLGLTALVIVATIGLVAYGQGYEYDVKSGRIIRTALVIIQSTPSSVPVTIDGRLLKKKTTYRASYKDGSYQFELTKPGYYPWHKTLAVEWPLVTMAQYAILVPRQPPLATLDTRPAIMAQSISRDHRHLAYVTGGSDGAIYTLDIPDGKPIKVYTPPKPAATDQPAETVTGVAWSDDASHLLVMSQLAGQPVHHLMAADGSGAIDLTQQYGFNFSGLTFSASNWQQLYWISPDGLRRLDVGAQAVSAVLADKVSQFQMAGDRVLYVQSSDAARTLWSLDGRGHKQELIPALPDSDAYAITYANYRGTDELAIVPTKTGVGTLYSDIYGSNPVAKVIARGVQGAQFSPDAHLLTFTASAAAVTYDLERSDLLGRLVSYQFSDVQDLRSLSWFDNFHVLMNRGGRLVWAEFDGANSLDLGAVASGFAPYATADQRSIVTIRPDGPVAEQVLQTTVKP